MNTYNKFLVLGLLVLFAGCASQIDLPKGVNYDYNINYDFSRVKTYDLRPTPTTVGIIHRPLRLFLSRSESQIALSWCLTNPAA